MIQGHEINSSSQIIVDVHNTKSVNEATLKIAQANLSIVAVKEKDFQSQN